MSSNNHRPSARVILEATPLILELAPEIGGSLASFRLRSGERLIDLMRPMTDAAWAAADPIGSAMFPMLPYANRIAGNQFDFEGRRYKFEKNYSEEKLNVHGSGWLSKWSVVEADQKTAELALNHLSPTDPYSYQATERFSLSPEGLAVTLEITNRGERRMPFGFGLHPWWKRDDAITLRFGASHFWLSGSESVPTDRIATPPELDFSCGRRLPQAWRNNCYADWDGRAELLFPKEKVGLRINADPIFRHVLLYADPDQPVFCLEPQTNAVCAFNRMKNEDEDLGVVILAPGESARGTVSFSPFSVEDQ
jgi:aldose 1-epimerase